MDDKSDSYVSLAKKLAAVRAALDEDERMILDHLVQTGNVDDLDSQDAKAHRMNMPMMMDDRMDVAAHNMDMPMMDKASMTMKFRKMYFQMD